MCHSWSSGYFCHQRSAVQTHSLEIHIFHPIYWKDQNENKRSQELRQFFRNKSPFPRLNEVKRWWVHLIKGWANYYFWKESDDGGVSFLKGRVWCCYFAKNCISVWPDVDIKSCLISSKICPKSGQSKIWLKRAILSF